MMKVGLVALGAMGRHTPLPAVDIIVKHLGIALGTACHGREDDTAVIEIFPGIDLPAKR